MPWSARLSLFAAALLAAPVTATAQTEEPTASSEIVVQGQKTQKKKIQRFVETLTPARSYEQLGRFHWEVCPAALGLGTVQNAQVVARIRQVAAASGAKVAREKCTANLFVIATQDKAAMIDLLDHKFDGLLTNVSKRKVKAMTADPSPAAAWHAIGLLNQDGTPIPVNPVTGWMFPSSMESSRLKPMTFPHFLGSVVVVDIEALRGFSTRQLADYAAMRALAPVDPQSYRHTLSGNPEAKLPAESILTLFEPGVTAETAPQSVTWWDFAFLKALYASNNVAYASSQRGDIRALMSRILASVPAEAR